MDPNVYMPLIKHQFTMFVSICLVWVFLSLFSLKSRPSLRLFCDVQLLFVEEWVEGARYSSVGKSAGRAISGNIRGLRVRSLPGAVCVSHGNVFSRLLQGDTASKLPLLSMGR